MGEQQASRVIRARALADYSRQCTSCGATPVVVIVEKNGHRIATKLCGACCFGSAQCVDPSEWAENVT